jgi:hypothetical protein
MEIKARRTAAEIERLAELHSQQKQVLDSHQQTVQRSQAALARICSYISHSLLSQSSQSLDLTTILDAFHQMQFQAGSLNDQFASLTKQENELKWKLEVLREEKRKMEGAASENQALQTSLARYLPDSMSSSLKQLQSFPTSSLQDRTAAKRLRQDEAFVCSVLISSTETLQKLQSYAQYIGKYVDLSIDIQQILSRPKASADDGRLLAPDTRIKAQRLTPRKPSRAIPEILPKVESSPGNNPMLRLREALVEGFGDRKGAIGEVLMTVVEILPVRVMLSEVSVGKVIERGKEWSEETMWNWTLKLVLCLLEEAHSSMRTRIAHSLSTSALLLKAIQDSILLTTAQIDQTELTETQQAAFARVKSQLLALNAGREMRKVPDKLWELLKATFEMKLRGLVKQQKGKLALESDFTSFVVKASSKFNIKAEESKPRPPVSLPISPVRSTYDHESEELAQQAELRRFQRLRPNPTLSRSNSDLNPPAISSISSMRRPQDLEKALLEQVQGIEKKIKGIKMTERDMERVRLPAVRRRRLGGSVEIIRT